MGYFTEWLGPEMVAQISADCAEPGSSVALEMPNGYFTFRLEDGELSVSRQSAFAMSELPAPEWGYRKLEPITPEVARLALGIHSA